MNKFIHLLGCRVYGIFSLVILTIFYWTLIGCTLLKAQHNLHLFLKHCEECTISISQIRNQKLQEFRKLAQSEWHNQRVVKPVLCTKIVWTQNPTILKINPKHWNPQFIRISSYRIIEVCIHIFFCTLASFKMRLNIWNTFFF